MKLHKNIFKKLFIGFLILIGILTLTSCNDGSKLIVKNVEVVTDSSKLETTDTLKIKIELKNPNKVIIEACEISKNDDTPNSYPVNMTTGKFDVCYVDIPNFKYVENDCYKLHSVSYIENEELKTFKFNSISTVKLHSTETPDVNLTVKKIELSNDELSYGQKTDIYLTLDDPKDSKPRYADITFTLTYKNGVETITTEITRSKLYLKGNGDYYTLTDVELPTEAEFEQKTGITLSDLESSSSLSWDVHCSKIQYGYSTEFVKLSNTVKTTAKLQASLFEILSGTTDFNFKSADNYDINGYLYLSKGTTVPYLTVTFTNKNDYVIKSLIINGYLYHVGSGLSLAGSVQYNKVGHEATILLTKAKLQAVDAEGLKIEGVKYVDANGEEKIGTFKEPYIYNAFRSYDVVVNNIEDLYVTNQSYTIDENNTIKSNIIFKNEIIIGKDELENTIFNGSYNFEGTIEGNGKTLTIYEQSKSLFNENYGTVRNLKLTGKFMLTEFTPDFDEETKSLYQNIKFTNPIICVNNYGLLKNLVIAQQPVAPVTGNYLMTSSIITFSNLTSGIIEDIEIDMEFANTGNKDEVDQTNMFYGMYSNEGIYHRTIMNITIPDVNSSGSYTGKLTITALPIVEKVASEDLYIHVPNYKEGDVENFILRSILFLTSENCKINYAFKTIVFNTYTLAKNKSNPKLQDKGSWEAKYETWRRETLVESPLLSWVPKLNNSSVTQEEQEAFEKQMEIIYNYYSSLNGIEFNNQTFGNKGFAPYTNKNTDNAFWKTEGAGITSTIHLDFSIAKERKAYTNANIY